MPDWQLAQLGVLRYLAYQIGLISNGHGDGVDEHYGIGHWHHADGHDGHFGLSCFGHEDSDNYIIMRK